MRTVQGGHQTCLFHLEVIEFSSLNSEACGRDKCMMGLCSVPSFQETRLLLVKSVGNKEDLAVNVTVRRLCGLDAQSCPTLATPWTVACQAPLSMRFSRQDYWSGLPCPSPGDLPDPGIKPGSPHWRQILYQLSYEGSPMKSHKYIP